MGDAEGCTSGQEEGNELGRALGSPTREGLPYSHPHPRVLWSPKP